MRQLHNIPSKKANERVVLITEVTYVRHDINGGRQARIRIRGQERPLKSVSEECDEN